MSLISKKKKQAVRRKMRVKSALKVNKSGVPRIAVFRSLKYFYAQLIDDARHSTVVSCSNLELDTVAGDKKTQAHAVGLELAKRAKAQGVEAAFLDRSGFLYHGRVKAFAEGLREGGLKI
jgi:large subunit ribosomal protein L18